MGHRGSEKLYFTTSVSCRCPLQLFCKNSKTSIQTLIDSRLQHVSPGRGDPSVPVPCCPAGNGHRRVTEAVFGFAFDKCKSLSNGSSNHDKLYFHPQKRETDTDRLPRAIHVAVSLESIWVCMEGFTICYSLGDPRGSGERAPAGLLGQVIHVVVLSL